MRAQTATKNPIAHALALAKPSVVALKPSLSFFEGLTGKDDLGLRKLQISSRLTEKENHVINTIIESLEVARELPIIAKRHQFLELPYEPLTWCDKDGWPVLVPFRLDSPLFSFHFDSFFEKLKMKPNFPQPIFDCFLDRLKRRKSEGKISKNREFEWETFFSGLIPASIIPIIQEARPCFEDIFIIAEVNGYKITHYPAPKPRPVNPDPLIVGYYDGKLYLIAAFDLTPLEKAYIGTGVRQLQRSKDCVMIHQIAGLLN